MISYAKKSRYQMFSPNTLTHRGKVIRDLSSSRDWSDFSANLPSMTFNYAYIPERLSNRADLISTAAYGTPGFWWLILFANNIEDAHSDLTPGKLIRIPEL